MLDFARWTHSSRRSGVIGDARWPVSFCDQAMRDKDWVGYLGLLALTVGSWNATAIPLVGVGRDDHSGRDGEATDGAA